MLYLLFTGFTIVLCFKPFAKCATCCKEFALNSLASAQLNSSFLCVLCCFSDIVWSPGAKRLAQITKAKLARQPTVKGCWLSPWLGHKTLPFLPCVHIKGATNAMATFIQKGIFLSPLPLCPLFPFACLPAWPFDVSFSFVRRHANNFILKLSYA